jgi:hypothetical protein
MALPPTVRLSVAPPQAPRETAAQAMAAGKWAENGKPPATQGCHESQWIFTTASHSRHRR